MIILFYYFVKLIIDASGDVETVDTGDMEDLNYMYHFGGMGMPLPHHGIHWRRGVGPLLRAKRKAAGNL